MNNGSAETIGAVGREERAALLGKMRAASDSFYREAAAAGFHRFLEFNGLIREYITLCEAAHEQDIDFTTEPVPLEPHHGKYLGEKLGCIFGEEIRRNQPVRQALWFTLLGVDERVQETLAAVDSSLPDKTLLVCPSCGAEADVTFQEQADKVLVDHDDETSLFTCPSCGAQADLHYDDELAPVLSTRGPASSRLQG